ncbi:MAG: flavodoxin family protein [Fibrobacterota bacterium]
MTQLPQVILINCSPRIHGNSQRVSGRIESQLSGICDIHPVRIHDLSLRPCGDCDKFCEKTGRCVRRDDMDKLYSLFDTTDAMVMVSPVYFYNFPGYAKIMIDRCQPYWTLKKEKQPARANISFSAAVMIGATKGEKLFFGMKQVFHSFSFVLGVKRVEPHHVLEIRRVDARGEIENYMKDVDAFIQMLKKEIGNLNLS